MEFLEELEYSKIFPSFLITSIIELWQIVINSTSKYTRNDDYVINGIITECETPKNRSNDFIYGIGGYHCICLVILSIMVKRSSFMKNKWNGRPGLLVPMNMLNSHDHIVEYTLLFLTLSEEIYNFIFQPKEDIESMIPLAKFFLKLLMAVGISVFSFPFFAMICNGILVGYFMVSFSSIAYLCVGIHSIYIDSYCLSGTKLIPLICAAVIPCSVDFAIVGLFVWKIISNFRRYGWGGKISAKLKNQRLDYSSLYVKELLKENLTSKNQLADSIEQVDGSVMVLLKHFNCNEMRQKIRERIYRQIPGFSIPPRLMIGIVVGLYFAYRIFIDNIYNLTPGAWNMISNLNDKLTKTKLSLGESFQIVSGNFSIANAYRIQNAFNQLTFFYARLLIFCLLTAVFVGLINSVIQTFLLLRAYRLHFHRLTKKGFSSMIKINKAPDALGLILGFVRYSGYQTSYTLWGILVVTGFVFLLLFPIIGFFLLPCIYLENSWARKLVINYGPVLIASIVFNFLQTLFVKYVFVKERGSLMEVDNRKGFMIYTHCAFFLNAMMGLFNSAKRMITWLFAGIFTFSRIDFSSLPDYIHGLDSGYMSYIGFLYTEQYHHNPILQCFSNILLESIDNSENGQYKMVTDKDKTRIRYRNLWHLSLTLINNEELVIERKRTMKKIGNQNEFV